MSFRILHFAVLVATAAGLAACDNNKAPQQQQRKVTYTDDVDPIMQKHCAECHVAGQAGAVESGFLTDSYESVMKGTRFGAVVSPGSATTSSLYNMVAGKGNLTVTMPHGRDPLSAAEVETIRLWIDDGAVEN